MARARAANLRYLRDWARLSYDHLRVLASLWNEIRSEMQADDSHAPAPIPPAPALVLEAEAGRQARGVFLIENTLARPVRGGISISAFADANGAEVYPTLMLEPNEVVLDPGEEVLVNVLLDMDESIPENVRFIGRFTVPGLSDMPVEVVVKRRPSTRPAYQPAQAAAPVVSRPVAAKKVRKPPAKRNKSAAKKKVAGGERRTRRDNASS
jgi:hypothetical protein